jgi:NADH:ubiquinone reductase (H+-translocating)
MAGGGKDEYPGRGAEMDTLTIIGGGFAGIQAARAASRAYPQMSIRLIDRNSYATMIPALPDILSGRFPADALIRPLADLLPPNCELIAERVTGVDLVSRTVRTETGTVSYDALVLAAGSTPARPPWDTDVVPAFGVQTLEQALELRDEFERRLATRQPLSVIVAGGGYTGLETAIALRDGCREPDRCEIRVVDPAGSLLPMITDAERERLLAFISSRGITVQTGTTINRVERSGAHLSDGTTVTDPLLIWAGGMRAEPVLNTERADSSRDGRLAVTPTLALPDHPEVFVAGDLAALAKDDQILRRAVNFAYYSGRAAGKNAARHLKGTRGETFSPVDLGWVIPLSDESAGRIFGAIRVGGKLGTRLHYLMCGFRHFGPKQAWAFYSAALALNRRMRPIGTPTPAA